MPEEVVYKMLNKFYAEQENLAKADPGFGPMARDFVGMQVKGHQRQSDRSGACGAGEVPEGEQGLERQVDDRRQVIAANGLPGVGNLRRDSAGFRPRALTHLEYNTIGRVRPGSGVRDNDGRRDSAVYRLTIVAERRHGSCRRCGPEGGGRFGPKGGKAMQSDRITRHVNLNNLIFLLSIVMFVWLCWYFYTGFGGPS